MFEPEIQPDGTLQWELTASVIEWETEPGKKIPEATNPFSSPATVQDAPALASRLADHRIPTRHDGAVLRFEDPWNTLIQVGVAA